MNDADLFAIKINEYVSRFGTDNVFDVDGVLLIVRMTDKKGSILPTDYCYNRYNNGLGDFSGHHLFEYTEDKQFRVLGEKYPYTGNVMHKPKGEPEYIWGHWVVGEFYSGAPEEISEKLLIKRKNLEEGIKLLLKDIPVSVITEREKILVRFQELLICGITIYDEAYRIYNATSDWANTTTYLCEEDQDGTWFYFLETMDECIGEIHRLVLFEAKKGRGKPAPGLNRQHTSELSAVLPCNAFEKTLEAFIKQADANAVSGKSGGGQTPYGFSSKPKCDGAEVSTHYGQGGASKTPYLNWWVVSIYYLPDSGNVIMGIEENRYSHLKEMQIKPMRYSRIGKKSVQIAVFYSAVKTNINHKELYENFINVCEEVIRLGLE